MQAQMDILRAQSIIQAAPYEGKAPVLRREYFQDVFTGYEVPLQAAEAVVNFQEYRIPVVVHVDIHTHGIELRDQEQEDINLASVFALLVIHSDHSLSDGALISIGSTARTLINAEINDVIIIVDD